MVDEDLLRGTIRACRNDRYFGLPDYGILRVIVILVDRRRIPAVGMYREAHRGRMLQ